jgi:hypothetical protein
MCLDVLGLRFGRRWRDGRMRRAERTRERRVQGRFVFTPIVRQSSASRFLPSTT